MKPSAQDFLETPQKSITLIGMSGVGKSFLSCMLEKDGWHNYSCDYLIAKKYLSAHVSDMGAVTRENIACLSDFVGQVGDPARGGVGLEEFRRRQSLYYDAECAVLRDMPDVLETLRGEGVTHFVNDSSGSLCEVDDEAILRAVGAHSLIVYLKVDPADHDEILKRALDYPKPLFFPAEFFDEHLKRYMEEVGTETVEAFHPHDFLRWVFPRLFTARLPKYERLADEHGVTLNAKDLIGIDTGGLMNLIAKALDG